MTGGGYKLNSTVGQPAAGFTKSTSFLHWIGFWAGEVPEPEVVPDIGAAKMLPDGTFVSISGKIATTSEADFTGFFYIEEEGRFSGIRVAMPGGPVAGLLRGHVVNVIGTLTTIGDERQLSGPIVIIVGTHAPLAPVGMPNRTVGGGDMGSLPLGQYGVTDGVGLNTVGLLIQTWGRVTATGDGYVVVDDGSGTPVRVDTSTLASPPDSNEYVSVIGISSLYKPGADRLRLILPRGGSDVDSY